MMWYLIFIVLIIILLIIIAILYVKYRNKKEELTHLQTELIVEDIRNKNKIETGNHNEYISRASGLDESHIVGDESNRPVVAYDRKVTYYDPWEQHAAHIVDSFRILKDTINPDTFFYRCKYAASEACHISDIPDIICVGKTAQEIYEWFYDKEEQIEFQKEFIDRLFSAGKEERLAYQLFEVGKGLNEEVLQYYLDRLNDKEFHFCKVLFDLNSNKYYTYITKNRTTAIGDTVVVHTGNKDFPQTKVVQVYDTFDAPLTSITFALDSLRCVQSTIRTISCPNCGASIQIDIDSRKGKCAYCRTDFSLL